MTSRLSKTKKSIALNARKKNKPMLAVNKKSRTFHSYKDFLPHGV